MKLSFRHTPLFLLLVFILPFYHSGCGYTQKTVLPADIKTIYVETLKNKIPLSEMVAYVPGVEMQVTNAIVRRLTEDGNLRVVDSREKADAILECDLKKFEQGGVRFNTLEGVEEYRLFIVVSARLINTKTREAIWEEPEFSGDAEYFVSTVRSIAREEAAQKAAERLARNLVDRIVEDW